MGHTLQRFLKFILFCIIIPIENLSVFHYNSLVLFRDVTFMFCLENIITNFTESGKIDETTYLIRMSDGCRGIQEKLISKDSLHIHILCRLSLLDPICYMGRVSDSICVSVYLSVCLSFQRFLSANRSPLVINLWS